MVGSEVNELNNTNVNRKPGILAAFKAIFAPDEENVNEEDVRREVELLEAESSKNIEMIQNRILSDRKQRRNKLSEELKPDNIEPLKNVNVKECKRKVDSKTLEK